MVIFSGRGLVLVWNIDPIPYMAMPLWRAVENYFMEQLKDLGADPKATDPARIFRLAGTINSKNQAVVKAEYRHAYRYDIHDLQYDYLPELSPKSQTKQKKGPKPKIIRLFNTYTLHLSRARDIAKLVELRHGDMDGYRETICFLYRYFTCCYTSDPQQALEDTLDLNSEFTHPLSDKEVITATKSAEKAWSAKTNALADAAAKAAGYPGAGYNIKNTKLIEWLDITKEEQMELSSIIDGVEKRRRNTQAKKQARRAAGVKPMKEYNRQRKKAVNDKVSKLQEILQSHPEWSNVRIGKEMGVSEGYIRKLRRNLSTQ
jgi:hypothetical protein